MKIHHLWLPLLPSMLLLISCASPNTSIPQPDSRTRAIAPVGGAPRFTSVGGIPIFIPGEGSEKILLDRMSCSFHEAGGAYGGSDHYFPIVLRAFRGGPQDLGKFFRLTYRSSLSAAGSECNETLTASLLYHWGDHQFAEVLSRQSPEVRRGVGEHLRGSTSTAFRKAFPITFKAALPSTAKNSQN